MPTQSVPSIMQAQHFEVVNAKGAIVFSIRATEAGGRLEVQDGKGATVFSVGVDPNDPEQIGLWEQSRQEIASQSRDLERQRRDLYSLTRRVQEIERKTPLSSHPSSAGNAFDQYRSELARHDRELDNLERQISRLSRQIDSLERHR
jgi:septal ring factor EnvC (AmiA/AmiB activator)